MIVLINRRLIDIFMNEEKFILNNNDLKINNIPSKIDVTHHLIKKMT